MISIPVAAISPLLAPTEDRISRRSLGEEQGIEEDEEAAAAAWDALVKRYGNQGMADSHHN